MTWRDRLRSTIELTSPLTDIYSAKWIGDPRSMKKKVGVFSYPNNVGSVVQDLDTEGPEMTLTLYFDGPENDTIAEEFFQSTKQNGVWTVNHPTKGNLGLQLLSVTEKIQPVTSGNITVFETLWIEPILDEELQSTEEISSLIFNNVDEINQAASDQFEIVDLGTFAKIAAVINTISSAVSIVQQATKSLTETIDEVDAAANAIQRGINDTMEAITLGPARLAAQIQQLILLPALIKTNFQTRFKAFEDMVDGLLGADPDSPEEPLPPSTIGSSARGLMPNPNNTSVAAKNTVLSVELVLSSILSLTPVIGSTSPFENRTESLAAMKSITDLSNRVTKALDNSQSNFEDVFIDNQYFSQLQSYNSISKSNALSNQLLIQKTFDLQVERRFILTKPTSPAQIIMKEHGSLDDKYDEFITSNNLSGDDILLLQAGREVVVYG